MISLRGCQKRIYHIKNIGGKYFDEAYLVLKDDAVRKTDSDAQKNGYQHLLDDIAGKESASGLAAEAEMIVRQALDCFAPHKSKNPFRSRGLAFALGAAASSALIGTVALIVGLSCW